MSTTTGTPSFPIGPNGRNPSVTLPVIHNYLINPDNERRDPDWNYNLRQIVQYLETAHRDRLNGELGYDDPRVCGMLEDLLHLVDVHRSRNDRTSKTPWSTDIIPSQPIADRLTDFPDYYIQPRSSRARSRYPVKRIDFCNPHSSHYTSPFPSLRSEDERNLYHDHEEIFFHGGDLTKFLDNHDDPHGNERTLLETSLLAGNKFQTENGFYEYYITEGIEVTGDQIPPRLAKPFSSTNTADPMPLDQDFYRARGWQRAALQQCLNMFTGRENRVINTPWRRAVLPFKEPVPMPKEIVYHGPALHPDRVPQELKDPFPFSYWYGQYSELRNTLAGWQRRSYNNDHWTEEDRTALPMNYHGPYTYGGHSIYDDHWLRMGDYLRRLCVLLKDTQLMAPRPFLQTILRDIVGGYTWRPGDAHLRRDILDPELVDLDRNYDEDDGERMQDKLIDEYDAAWLRYLCQPSCNVNASDTDPTKRLQDNLAILFDARLQDFFNNRGMSSNPEIGRAITREKIWNVANNPHEEDLQRVLDYINGGQGAEQCHANETHQFTIEEARRHILRLSNSNRCLYYFENENPDTPRSVGQPRYHLHPEHRVRWRHGFDVAARRERYAGNILEALTDAYGLNDLTKVFEETDVRGILDHTGDRTFDRTDDGTLAEELLPILNGASPNPVDVENALRRRIHGELDFVHGSYRDDELTQLRHGPSWSDLQTWDQTRMMYEYASLHIYQTPHNPEAPTFPVPERTAQFFRNLAWRMGRTLRYITDLEQRYLYTATDAEGGQQVRWWQPISRQSLLQGIDHWEKSIQYGMGEIAFMPPTLEGVVDKADPSGTLKNQLRDQSWYTIVREGIINECVQNHNTLYPGRLTPYEDSAGYFRGTRPGDSAADNIYAGTTRPSLFKWATKEQRRFQAPFTRHGFFDMRRWPLQRQPVLKQRLILGREDEIRRVDPCNVRQAFGILTTRLPTGEGRGRRRQWFGTNGTTPAWRTRDTSGVGPSGAAPPQMQPYTRSKHRFIPGPAIFPMAETLLQSLVLSDSLERTLYPRPPRRWYHKPLDWYNDFVKIEPARVPLLPPTDKSEITPSNPRKRKIPASNLIRADRLPNKRVKTAPERRQAWEATKEKCNPEEFAPPPVEDPGRNAPPGLELGWRYLRQPYVGLQGAFRAITDAMIQEVGRNNDFLVPGEETLLNFYNSAECQPTAGTKGELNDSSPFSLTLNHAHAALQAWSLAQGRRIGFIAVTVSDTTAGQYQSANYYPPGRESFWLLWIYAFRNNSFSGIKPKSGTFVP